MLSTHFNYEQYDDDYSNIIVGYSGLYLLTFEAKNTIYYPTMIVKADTKCGSQLLLCLSEFVLLFKYF